MNNAKGPAKTRCIHNACVTNALQHQTATEIAWPTANNFKEDSPQPTWRIAVSHPYLRNRYASHATCSPRPLGREHLQAALHPHMCFAQLVSSLSLSRSDRHIRLPHCSLTTLDHAHHPGHPMKDQYHRLSHLVIQPLQPQFPQMVRGQDLRCESCAISLTSSDRLLSTGFPLSPARFSSIACCSSCVLSSVARCSKRVPRPPPRNSSCLSPLTNELHNRRFPSSVLTSTQTSSCTPQNAHAARCLL